MARTTRQAKIIELVSEREIETQEEICEELIRAGYNVTQATVSRDVKELGLIKVLGSAKKYRYSYTDSRQMASGKMINLFRQSVLSIRPAQNLVLVKTLSGGGSSAGMCVDKLNYPEIVGSVAGDDTLLIVTDTDEHANEVTKKLKELLV